MAKDSNIKSWVVNFIATAGGAGSVPKGPGTAGSLVGIPLALVSHHWVWEWQVLLWVGVLALGTWSAALYDKSHGSHDNSQIVIDEVLGMGISAAVATEHWLEWLIAFVLFRFFDIVKPPPIAQLDRWSKKQTSDLMTGFGVMLDDIVAGIAALGCFLLLRQLGLMV